MRRDALVHPRRELLREVLHERRNVIGPLAQRRIENRKDVEAIVEIAAELLVGDHLREIAVGCRDEPDVDADGAGAAQPLELLLLQHTQELRLQLERDVADFVEEQRAAVRQLEPADLLRDGARERAFLVSEELALEQPRWNRGAVELDERSRSAAAQVVNRSRDRALCPCRSLPGSARSSRSARRSRSASARASAARLSPTISSKLCSLRISRSRYSFSSFSFSLSSAISRYARPFSTRDRDLLRDLAEQLDVVVAERIFVEPADVQRAQNAIVRLQRDAAERFHPFREKVLGDFRFGGEIDEILLVEHRRRACRDTRCTRAISRSCRRGLPRRSSRSSTLSARGTGTGRCPARTASGCSRRAESPSAATR